MNSVTYCLINVIRIRKDSGTFKNYQGSINIFKNGFFRKFYHHGNLQFKHQRKKTAGRRCQLPVSAIGNKAVTTIEGLSEKGDHPVQKAWLEHDVAQCGYCQTGQIMTAAALLKAKPNPTEAQIEAAMTGNICRCGTYLRIRDAIKSAAKQQ